LSLWRGTKDQRVLRPNGCLEQANPKLLNIYFVSSFSIKNDNLPTAKGRPKVVKREIILLRDKGESTRASGCFKCTQVQTSPKALKELIHIVEKPLLVISEES